MTEYRISVKGMYCTACENRIQKNISKLEGVKSCKADYQKEEVLVCFDGDKSIRKKILATIEDLGYETRRDSDWYIQIGSLLIILLALYLIADHLGLLAVFRIFPSIETTMSYGMVFVIGLLTSVHCIAMCGGINLSQSVMAAKKEKAITKSNLLYNLGRIVSYTVVGGVVGGIGSVVTLHGKLKGLMAILAGVVMLIMAFNMLGMFKALRRWNLHLPKGFYQAGAKLIRGRSSFYIGLLNGLMPCGPLQSMQIYALSTGSVIKGAISMFLFSLGTTPLMFGFGAISGKLNKKYAKYLLTISAVIIFVMGLSMVGNGLSLSGIGTVTKRSTGENMAVVEGMEQHVITEIDYGSYEAITVKQGIPVVWTINVPKGKLNGCNGELIIPAYDLDVKLVEGENIVRFTPQETGVVPYSCWMGMIKSQIKVIDR